MTRRWRQIMLGLVASLCAVCLAILLLHRDLLSASRMPETFDGAAAWLAKHPADVVAASMVADGALDTDTPRRLELWHAAYSHARRLAPYRPNADTAFVRAGLFHWYELGPEDRARVLAAAEPLMRDPAFFGRMFESLWQLTRDFAWLQANAPEALEMRGALRDLAVARGLFGEYRMLREDVRVHRMKQFAALRGGTDPLPLLALLPERLTVADEPLVRGILEELDHKPFNPEAVSNRVDMLVDYAARHDIQPLTGILPLLEATAPMDDVTRARAALDLHNANAASRIEITSAVTGKQEWEAYFLDRAVFEARRHDAAAANAYLVRAAGHAPSMSLALLAAGEKSASLLGNTKVAAEYRRQLEAHPKGAWSGLCSPTELCTNAWRHEYGDALRLRVTTTQSDEIPPYVEVYVDDALLAEGPVRDARVFDMRVQRGLHRVDVRLVNGRTRNGIQRRVGID